MFAKPLGMNTPSQNLTLAKLNLDYFRTIDIYFAIRCDLLYDLVAAPRSSGFHFGCLSLHLVRQLEAEVGDTLDIPINTRLRLHTEHGCDRRTQVVLINIGGILCARCKTRCHTHHYGQYAADCTVPQVTGLQAIS